MAHDEYVRAHRVQRYRRIDERLALLHRGLRDGHVHHIGAEALAGEFEGRLRTGGGFEEEIDLRASAQDRFLFFDLAVNRNRFLGEVEEGDDLFGRQTLYAQ